MILDILENSDRYLSLHKGFAKAFRFLSRPDLKELAPGRYEIEGDRIYAMISLDAGRRKEDALLETHEKFIDIQFILAGIDTMGWKPKLSCIQPSQDYDGARDIQFFADQPDAWVAAKAGAFTLFFPQDAHMPLISNGQIHKVVVKVAVTF